MSSGRLLRRHVVFVACPCSNNIQLTIYSSDLEARWPDHAVVWKDHHDCSLQSCRLRFGLSPHHQTICSHIFAFVCWVNRSRTGDRLLLKSRAKRVLALSLGWGVCLVLRDALTDFQIELNDSLFPLETDDYPHTRGIRVEIAGIILISALGVMSQVKLWKIIKERKGKKDADKRLEEADLEAVDEETGRRVEEQHRAERKQWEAKYGVNNEATEAVASTPPSRDGSKADSGIGEMRTAGNSVEKFEETPEMKEARQEHEQEVQAAVLAGESRVIGEAAEMTAVTSSAVIQVGTDVMPSRSHRNSETPSSLEPIQEVGAATAAYEAAQQEIKRETRWAQVPPTPAVIPLPLPVPAEIYNDDESFNDSSVAARAESPQFAAGVEDPQSPVTETASQSGFIMGFPANDDQASSVDATCDEPELVDDDMLSDRHSSSSGASAVTATEGSSTPNGETEESLITTPGSAEPATEKAELAKEVTVDVTPENVGKAMEQIEQSKPTKSVSSARHSRPAASRRASTAVSADLPVGLPQDLAPASFPESASPSTATRSNRGELQTHCSKIFKTYRTNEWAKHLSNAEKPELDELDLDHLYDPIDDSEQKPAPLDMQALQETAEVVPAPRSLPWTETPFSRTETPFRSFSTPGISTIEQASRSITSPVYASPITNQPIAPEARSGTPFSYSTPIRPPVVTDRPTASNRFSNTPTTLLSQRQSMVRSRSNLGNFITPPEGSRLSNQPPQRPPSVAPYSPVSYTFQPPRELDDDMPLSNRREILSRESSCATLKQQPPARLKSPMQPTPSPRQQDPQADLMRSWRKSLRADQETQVMSAMAEQRRSEMLDKKVRRIQSEKLKPQSGFTNDDIGMETRMRQGDLNKAHQEAMRRMQDSANRRL